MTDIDTILILGHRLNPDDTPSDQLRSRIDTAVALWRENGEPLIIPCGGITRDRSLSEAEVMRGMLIERGVPAEKIRLEDRSRTTTENIRNAVSMLEPGAQVALVTSEYHLEHALYECERFGIAARGVPAPTPDETEREQGYEMCRRFLADQKDFSEENLQKAGIRKRFSNETDKEALFREVASYISAVREGRETGYGNT